tara:strand:- start:423 stop:1085 length:663 start_codon:yes stop_codon:yes gene_type:complete
MSEGFLEITSTDAEIEQMIIRQIADHLNSVFPSVAEEIERKIKPDVFNAIYECNELQALRGSYLRGSLGLTSPKAVSASGQIAEAVSESVSVKAKKVNPKNLSGGLEIFVQPDDYSNVLSISDAVVSYRSKRFKRNIDIPWLDWLLTKGDQILVFGFEFDPVSGRGRSGAGRMLESPMGDWRISPEHAGTKGDNFITRAFDRDTQNKIVNAVKKIINKRL